MSFIQPRPQMLHIVSKVWIVSSYRFFGIFDLNCCDIFYCLKVERFGITCSTKKHSSEKHLSEKHSAEKHTAHKHKNMKYSTYWKYSKSSEKGHQNFVLSFFPASPLFCRWLNWSKNGIQNAFSSTIFSRSLLALKDISIPFSIKNLIQVKI